jgi:hypothetical protein
MANIEKNKQQLKHYNIALDALEKPRSSKQNNTKKQHDKDKRRTV